MEFGWTPGPAVVFPFASLLKILLFSSLYLFYLNCDRCAAQPWAQAAAGAGAELGPGEAGGHGGTAVSSSMAECPPPWQNVPLHGGASLGTAHTDAGGFFLRF